MKIGFCCWAIVCVSSLAAWAQTTREAAQVWLDRARGELEVRAEQAKLKAVGAFGEMDLAVELVRLRGDEKDRAVLRKLMAIPLDRPEGMEAEAFAVFKGLAAAKARAALGEAAKAEQLLHEAEAKSKTVLNDDGMRPVAAELMRASWVEIGKPAEAIRRIDQNLMRLPLMQYFWLTNNRAEGKRVLAELKSIAREAKDWETMQWTVQALARLGEEDEVLTAAYEMPAGAAQVRAYRAIAWAAFVEGRSKDAACAIDMGILSAREAKLPIDDWLALAQSADDCGLRGLVGDVVTELEAREAEMNTGTRRAKMAMHCAAAGKDALLEKWLTRARESDLHPAARTRQAWSQQAMLIGAALARAGKVEEMSVELNRAARIFREKDYAYSDEMSAVLNALVNAGKHDDAERVSREWIADAMDRWTVTRKIALTKLAAKDWENAWKIAARMDYPEQIWVGIQAFILRKCAESGDFGQAERLLNQVPSGNGRIAMELHVAAELLGTRMMLEMMTNPR